MTSSSTFRFLALLTFALLVGCSGRLDDGRFATGSRPMVASADYSVLYAADTDGGTVARIDAVTKEVVQVDVGLEPTRIARAGERLFVTLRGERNLAILEEGDSGLTLVSKIPVGAEPFGVVADEGGRLVYVVASMAGEVHEIDAESLEILRTWSIRDEPRWLALHPSGDSLFVGSVRQGSYFRIDLNSGAVESQGLPEVLSVHLETFDAIELVPRITGDMAISPNGKVIAIPVLYVDNVSPVSDPILVSDDDDDVEGEGDMVVDVGSGYGNTIVSRFNPGVVTVALDPHGEFSPTEPRVIQLNGTGVDFELLRSYPAGVTFSPDGDSILATLEGSGAVLAVPVDAGFDAESRPTEGSIDGDELMSVTIGGPTMETRSTRTYLTPAGPQSVAFVGDDRAWTYSFLDREVARIDHSPVVVGDIQPQAPGGSEEAASGALLPSVLVEFAGNSLPADVEAGRRLFYSTNDSRMAGKGSGVSCATCHFGGRNDGLTWTFQSGGQRQTPSLAGVVSLTAPVTWTDEVPSVMDEVVITSQGRMGGSGLSELDALKVASYVDWSREVDLPLADSTSASVLRGQEVFEREDVGCADCHNGVSYTDNEAYDMYGLEGVQTRSLVGVAATAPYLHDGSAPSIEAVLLGARDGSMGDTSSLTDQEMDDLAEFLKSL
ncbi:MAG: hypothetical protein VX498_07895 [Myxococcota bacterium]|nr:hypothetical protein [Myxococcota bacterium]